MGRQESALSFENRPKKLSPDFLRRFKADKPAWEFFSKQAPWYQRVIIYLIMEGKKPETREKRLAHVVATSAKGKRIAQLVPKSKRT